MRLFCVKLVQNPQGTSKSIWGIVYFAPLSLSDVILVFFIERDPI